MRYVAILAFLLVTSATLTWYATAWPAEIPAPAFEARLSAPEPEAADPFAAAEALCDCDPCTCTPGRCQCEKCPCPVGQNCKPVAAAAEKPQAATVKIKGDYQWVATPWPGEIALKINGAQVGSYHYDRGHYRSVDGDAWGEPTAPPVALPATRPVYAIPLTLPEPEQGVGLQGVRQLQNIRYGSSCASGS